MRVAFTLTPADGCQVVFLSSPQKKKIFTGTVPENVYRFARKTHRYASKIFAPECTKTFDPNQVA
jgi:hypothetical protein